MALSRHQPLHGVALAVGCSIAFAVLFGYWPIRVVLNGGLPITADDAFYYFEIARRLASTGRSTFDGQVLTNGYHPLWQLILTLQYLLIGESTLTTVVVE